MSSLWEKAKVAEPIGLDDAQNFGAFVLNTGEITILSMTPAEDFEINTNVVQGWKLILMDDEEILGDLDYFVALARLKSRAIDEQNGSLLINACTRDDLEKLLDNS